MMNEYIKSIMDRDPAAKNIYKGEKFTRNNLTMKRPGNGISPMKLPMVLGKVAKKNFLKDELIKL